MENYILLSVVAIYGLMIGSFLSVCIFRIPFGRPKGLESLDVEEKDEPFFEKSSLSILEPKRSFCPECQHTLAWHNNIPLFSYLFQFGKCSYCKVAIPFRYPLVELLSAIFAVACFLSFPLPSAILVYIFLCSLIVISFIDLDYFIIPNIISIPGMIIACFIAIFNQFFYFFPFPIVANASEAFFGFLAGAGFLFFISEVYLRLRGKVGLGFGDVKLLGMIGLLFGPQASLATIMLGSILGSVIGIAIILIGGHKVERPIPFGPYLALGCVIYLFFGNPIQILMFVGG